MIYNIGEHFLVCLKQNKSRLWAYAELHFNSGEDKYYSHTFLDTVHKTNYIIG